MEAPLDYEALSAILDELEQLAKALHEAETYWDDEIRRVDSGCEASARNLAYYWGVRQHDLREMQLRLARFGLSSIGRSEPHVQASLDAITTAAEALLDFGVGEPRHGLGFDDGARLLTQRASELFGEAQPNRDTRIMVTLPTEAATDESLARDLIVRGMNVARVNCAHDRPEDWAAMAAHVRAVSLEAGRECRIAMDLAGPKLRTGPLADGPRVVRLRPTRDPLGRVVAAARFRFAADTDTEPESLSNDGPRVPVPASWLARLRPGDLVDVRDTRGAARQLRVDSNAAGVAEMSVADTTYLATGTKLTAPDGLPGEVGELPAVPTYLTLSRGDDLILSRDCTPAPVGEGVAPRIGCTLPEVFDHISDGDLVDFDDGRITGRVTAVSDGEVTVRITMAAGRGSRLRAGKGINLPETTLAIPALTPTDRSQLGFVAAHADIVELSFVRSADDVEDLLAALDEIGAQHLGVVVKIETAQAFENLPEILFALMRRPRVGVMIARGDLAVECGYERLAELQEEILWLCEAAHLPVIWATEVLDRMARSGRPSRAEITDAAMGERAECVMLNKGPHIVDAVAALDDVLRRMGTHHAKKNALMRPLRSWGP